MTLLFFSEIESKAIKNYHIVGVIQGRSQGQGFRDVEPPNSNSHSVLNFPIKKFFLKILKL